MKHRYQNINTQNINAETLLALWEDIPPLSVCYEGIFARNFANDLMRTDAEPDKTVVSLSRNGIFHLLPQGLFFTENQLKEKQKQGADFKSAYDKLKKQKQDAQLFFQPLDTELFKLSLEGEQKLNHCCKTGNTAWLSNLPDDSKNEYIRKIIPLLAYTNQLRGNMQLLTDLMKLVLEVEKVEIVEIKPLHAQFVIHKEKLSKEQYLTMTEEVEPFFDFFKRQFLPIEKEYDFKIKDFKHPFQLGASLILDYNTHL